MRIYIAVKLLRNIYKIGHSISSPVLYKDVYSVGFFDLAQDFDRAWHRGKLKDMSSQLHISFLPISTSLEGTSLSFVLFLRLLVSLREV